MQRMLSRPFLIFLAAVSAVGMTTWLLIPVSARADEAGATRLLKAMSDYLAAQIAMAFDYDATLEIVTSEGQMLSLASSGDVALVRHNRPIPGADLLMSNPYDELVLGVVDIKDLGSGSSRVWSAII